MAQKIFLKYQWMIFLVWQHPRGTFIDNNSDPHPDLLTLELTVNVFQSSGAFPLRWAPCHLEKEMTSVCDAVHFLVVIPKLQPPTKPWILFLQFFPFGLASSPFTSVPLPPTS